MRLIYIHGFNSSCASHKAQLLKHWLRDANTTIDYHTPTLSHQPQQAIEQLAALITAQDPTQVALIGSSLGGYYATYLVERYACAAALINPTVRPYELLQAYYGENINTTTQETYTVDESHFTQLRDLDTPIHHPAQYLLMVETGDEILDYRQAVSKYHGAKHCVIEGGDHAFRAFEEKIPDMLAFLKVR